MGRLLCHFYVTVVSMIGGYQVRARAVNLHVGRGRRNLGGGGGGIPKIDSSYCTIKEITEEQCPHPC